jgi:hypothetical protein
VLIFRDEEIQIPPHMYVIQELKVGVNPFADKLKALKLCLDFCITAVMISIYDELLKPISWVFHINYISVS